MANDSQSIQMLDSSAKETVIEKWKKLGHSASDIATLEADFAIENTPWYAITQEVETVAVFSLIPAPVVATTKYFKSMKIYFPPQKIEEEVQFNVLEQNLYKITQALAESFSFMLDHAHNNSQEKCCKIYNDHPLASFWYYEFAKQLQEKHPNIYTVKLYGKWIEIVKAEN